MMNLLQGATLSLCYLGNALVSSLENAKFELVISILIEKVYLCKLFGGISKSLCCERKNAHKIIVPGCLFCLYK
jgi:hypothetical protein